MAKNRVMDGYGNFTKVDQLPVEQRNEIDRARKEAAKEAAEAARQNAAAHGNQYVSPAAPVVVVDPEKEIMKKQIADLTKVVASISSLPTENIVDEVDADKVDKAVADLTPEPPVVELTPQEKAKITKRKNVLIKQLTAGDVATTGDESLEELEELALILEEDTDL